MKMLVKNFLRKIAPDVQVIIHDLDNPQGVIKEGLAGELAPAYRNNYNSFVTDFFIEEKPVYIYITRF